MLRASNNLFLSDKGILRLFRKSLCSLPTIQRTYSEFFCPEYGKGILAKSEARRQRFAGCPPSPSEPAVSYLNTSYKFFVPRLWKRSGGLGREKSPQWRRGTLERSSTQSKLERRGLKKDPRILDKEKRPLSSCLPSGYWLHSGSEVVVR